MNYIFSELYFESQFLQEVVQSYFDTVLQKLIENPILESKGLFKKGNKVLYDGYDMPYHIHILNGLLPMLRVYEQWLGANPAWMEEATLRATELRVLILGFTFHDSNKLFKIDDLKESISSLEQQYAEFGVPDFFPEFEEYRNDVYRLALATEGRTSVQANDFPSTLEDDFLDDILAHFCHFADGLASISELDEVANTYQAVQKHLGKLLDKLNTLTTVYKMQVPSVPLSYIEMLPNPYILLSQNTLHNARRILAQRDAKGRSPVFFTLRHGFVYFGKDWEAEELQHLLAMANNKGEDITPKAVVDAQKCNFDSFLGSVDFTLEVLNQLIEEQAQDFLKLSPNGSDKIQDCGIFVELCEALVLALSLPVQVNFKNGKVGLRFQHEEEEDWYVDFVRLFCTYKMMWLNGKIEKKWEKDYKEWLEKEDELPVPCVFGGHTCHKVSEVVAWIKTRTKSATGIFKTLLCLLKAYQEVMLQEDIEDFVEEVQVEFLGYFSRDGEENTVGREFIEKYFYYKGCQNLDAWENYLLVTPVKREMCAFTGSKGEVAYKQGLDFGLKARGFSNRTVTTLNNNVSYISALYAEENKLRRAVFPGSTDANTAIYQDFYEAVVDFDRELLRRFVKDKGTIEKLERGVQQISVEVDKNVRFEYNLYNMNFDKLGIDIESCFFFIRKHLLMVQKLGIRTYVTGVMSPYEPHKEVFCFENAPRWVQQLGWGKVRLVELEGILSEIRLLLLFGKNKLKGNILKVAESRYAYFTLYYLLDKDGQKKVFGSLEKFILHNSKEKFILHNSNNFNSMTVTENLVELGVQIKLGYESGSEETWLIRTALDYLRKNVKARLSREDIIQQVCGNIYKTLRKDKPDEEAIVAFATAVYDELFVGQWKSILPNLNREKDWIYQFAFLYRLRSLSLIRARKAQKIQTTLEQEGKEINLENIRAFLKKDKKGSEKYAGQYLKIITSKK